MKGTLFIRAGLAAILAGAVLFLTLRASPHVSSLSFIPLKTAYYLDAHDKLRNFLGFATVAVAINGILSGFRREQMGTIALRILALGGMITLIECAQFFLPTRFPDAKDVLTGAAGAIVGSLPWLRWRKSRDSARAEPLFGIPFWNGSCAELLKALHASGGLLVAPSAPSLCAASRDETLWRAHVEADYAVMDSGFLDLLLRVLGQRRPQRISGHQVIEHLLASPGAVSARDHRMLWVVPSEGDKLLVGKYLEGLGFQAEKMHFYTAPLYRDDSHFRDEKLAAAARACAAQWIILCIGGGRQEKLGFHLREMLGVPAPILCTGAAIFFFCGGQARIPRWADRLYLGWLLRIGNDPRRFLPRYLAALELPLALCRLARRQKQRSMTERA